MTTEIRIDKWLWTVRLFKTRSLAAEACRKGRVLIAGIEVKPSRLVQVGDVVQVKRSPVLFSYEIIAITPNRVGAKSVPNFLLDVTTPDQIELHELGKIAAEGRRVRGAGRPTKKERRDLDDFFEPVFFDD